VSHVSESILDSTKKTLNLGASDTSFDVDVVLHINSVFSILTQLGIGPAEGFMIQDSVPTWDAFIGADPRFNLVKTYVFLRVRLLFDPPTSSFALDSFQKQIDQFEWRLNVLREGESWTDPTVVTS
jgi:hypothetical protein